MADGTKTCGYCGYRIDIEDELAFRKTLPLKVHKRLAHSMVEDGQGRLYHQHPWQCLRAHQRAEDESSVAES